MALLGLSNDGAVVSLEVPHSRMFPNSRQSRSRTRKIAIEFPRGTWERISRVIDNDSLYEGPEDLILHAVTDLLETYRGKN